MSYTSRATVANYKGMTIEVFKNVILKLQVQFQP